ncbi:MAG TPA: FkbM family methyltransferase [Bryobacteraceae bacterium]|nr:FkbM family methyltransferase [Bryobacteraceae bacterium]
MKKLLLAAPFVVLPCIIGGVVSLRFAQQKSDCPLINAIKGGDDARIEKALEDARPAMRKVRSEGDMQLWETPHGSFWIPQSSAARFDQVIGEQKADIYNASQVVHPGDVVLDCGADVGTFTRTALNHGASKVIAVEPAPWKIPCLRRTFTHEIEQGRVVIYPKGVWSSETTLLLDGDTIKSNSGVAIPLTTIDRIVSELQLERLDLVKMDIEGAEKPAIQGGRETIRRFKPRFTIATEHNADDHSAIPALLMSIEPSYAAHCGPCVVQFGRLQPYTMQFIAR